MNHLILVNAPGWLHTFSPSTDSDNDQVSGTTGASMVMYTLYADPSGDSRHPQELFQLLMSTIVAGCQLVPGAQTSTLPQSATPTAVPTATPTSPTQAPTAVPTPAIAVSVRSNTTCF